MPIFHLFAQIDPTLGIVFAALAGALGTYVVAARNLSGRIKNSEASDLWAESSKIRDWSAGQINELNAKNRELEQRLNELEAKNGELADENRRLIRENYDLKLKVQLLEGAT